MTKILRKTVVALVAVAALALGGACAGQDSDSDDNSGSAQEFCYRLYKEDLAPTDWTYGEFKQDCRAALESGWNRPALRDAYEDIKEDGG